VPTYNSPVRALSTGPPVSGAEERRRAHAVPAPFDVTAVPPNAPAFEFEPRYVRHPPRRTLKGSGGTGGLGDAAAAASPAAELVGGSVRRAKATVPAQSASATRKKARYIPKMRTKSYAERRLELEDFYIYRVEHSEYDRGFAPRGNRR
jgi:hypothetical protein